MYNEKNKGVLLLSSSIIDDNHEAMLLFIIILKKRVHGHFSFLAVMKERGHKSTPLSIITMKDISKIHSITKYCFFYNLLEFSVLISLCVLHSS